VADGLVEHTRVVLLDEAGELFVGNEQKHHIDGVVVGGVVTDRQLRHPMADVAEERLPVALTVEVGVGLDEADVVVEGELDVHVTDLAGGQEEGEIGDSPAVGPPLLAVVHPVDHPRQLQDVVGHALTPLAPRLGARQRLPELVSGLGQGRRLLAGGPELTGQVTEFLLTVALEAAHELDGAGQLSPDLSQLAVDELLLGVELPGLRRPMRSQALVGHGDHVVDRGRPVVLGAQGHLGHEAAGQGSLVPEHAGDHADDDTDHGQQPQRRHDEQVHGHQRTKGVRQPW